MAVIVVYRATGNGNEGFNRCQVVLAVLGLSTGVQVSPAGIVIVRLPEPALHEPGVAHAKTGVAALTINVLALAKIIESEGKILIHVACGGPVESRVLAQRDFKMMVAGRLRADLFGKGKRCGVVLNRLFVLPARRMGIPAIVVVGRQMIADDPALEADIGSGKGRILQFDGPCVTLDRVSPAFQSRQSVAREPMRIHRVGGRLA